MLILNAPHIIAAVCSTEITIISQIYIHQSELYFYTTYQLILLLLHRNLSVERGSRSGVDAFRLIPNILLRYNNFGLA